jgi:hypothetical protein
MRPGRWVARFRVAAGSAEAQTPFGLLDVAVGPEAEVIARQELTSEVLPPDGGLHEVALPFQLSQTELSVELRAQTYGAVPMSALLHVDVELEEPPVRAGSEHRLETARA